MSAPFIDLDLHEMNTDEARIEIDRQLSNVDSGTYHIRLIHGFHGGTRLRDMIYTTFKNNKKVKRVIPGDNEGITVLVLREL